jgi:cell division protein FtsQ
VGTRVRRRANRKLQQRRKIHLRLPDLRALAAGARSGLRRAAPLFALAAALAVCAAGAWGAWHWVTRSPRFAIRHVSVAGNTRVTEQEILAEADVAPGANLFRTSTDAIEARLARNPWIARARVSRRLPDGLRIDIRERQPAALVILGNPYLADAQGRPFKRAVLERGEADGLPVVTGISRAAWQHAPETGAAAVREALAVDARWRAVAGRPAIGEIHLDRGGITLYTLDGAVALLLGRAQGSELDARLARFDVIWASLSDEERAKARRIHLDSATRPDRVTVELAER